MKRLSFLLAVLFLVASVPAAATTTPGDEVTYKRVSVWDTDFGQQVKACVDAYVDTYTGIGEALYDVYLGFFDGFTDKNGVVHEAVVPMTDDRGYVWYPVPFVDASYSASFDLNNSYTTGSYSFNVQDRYLLSFDSFLTPTSSSYNGRNIASSILFRPTTVSSFVIPKTSNYSVYLSGDWSIPKGSMVSALYFEGASFWEFNQLVSFGSKTAGTSFVPAQQIFNIFNPVTYPDGARQFCNLRMYLVDRGTSSGSAFSGFGGGSTRGAGASRKLDLVSATKVSAGTGISRSDILSQYAIFDEGTKTVNIPQDDGTTVTKTAESWVYDYPTRTYTITTPTKEIVKVVYAEDKVSVTDSSNTPKEYYYAEPEPLPTTASSESTTTSGGGTTTAPDDSGGGGIFGIFGWLKGIVYGIFVGIGDLFNSITAAFNAIASFGTGFANLISHYFSYIPSEVAALIVLSFSALVLLRIFGR